MIYSTMDVSLSRFLFRRDCRLKHLIAAAYTVDCQTLISLASALYNAVSAGEAGGCEMEAPSLVDACLEFQEIRQCAGERLFLYTQYAPDNAGLPAVLYENGVELFRVCGRVVKGAAVFHPKLLLAVFENRTEGRLEFQLQVGSKNLTAGSALELAVCLESGERSSAGDAPNGWQLAQFFRDYGLELPAEAARALGETEFRIWGGDTEGMRVSGIVFAASRPERPLSRVLYEDCRRRPPVDDIHVFSPFLRRTEDGGAFWGEDLGKDAGRQVLYHTALTRALLEPGQKENLYVAKADQRFCHGKLIMWPTARRAVGRNLWEETFRIWVGSANATKNGMEKNCELMAGFLMTLTHSDTARENRYPNYCPASSGPRRTHLLTAHNGSQVSPAESISYHQASSVPLSEADCAAESRGPLLRRLLGELSLRARLAGRTPVVELRLGKGWSGAPRCTFCLMRGERQLCALRGWNSACFLAERELPPNGVYQLCILDEHARPILETCIQAERASDGIRFPDPTPMTSLLTELKALRVIPNCASRGFSRGDDDVYRRLRAFLCSVRWDGSAGHPAFQRLKKRLEAAAECLEAPDGRSFMDEREKEYFQALRSFVNAVR